MFRKLLSFAIFCFVAASTGFAQSGSISGTVTDSQSGEPLAATNIYIPELERGASANADGEFTINNVPAGTYSVRATFIGFSDNTKQVEVGDGNTAVNFQMVPSSANLEELVVVGFGETSRRNLTDAVSSVTSEEIEEAHLTTFEGALQGKAAGVQVTSSSGVLGAPVSVRVRGVTSINASSQPLYVVDGVPLTDSGGGIGANRGATGSGGLNPFINLNPDDIKSIQVLKSATAAAVYGARGSNGVVLIETKDGQAGQTQINVGTSLGYTEPTERYDVLNGPQFAEMLNYAAGGQVFDPSTVPSTDWADIVTRTGTIQNYKANVSGGSEETQFYISGKYSDEEGYARPNQLQRFSALAKVDHTFNDYLDVGLSINPSRSFSERVAISNAVTAPYTYAALIAPIVPARLDDGTINNGRDPSAPTNAYSAFPGTPLGNALGDDYESTVAQVNTSAYADYSFTQNLALRTDFAVQYLQIEEEQKLADYTTDGYPIGAGFASNSQTLNYNWNNTLTYTNDWEDHSLTAVAGITFQREEVNSISLSGDTYLSNQLRNLASAANITAGTGSGTIFTFQNNLARVNYAYKDKYLLTLTGSYNGSSRFGEDNQYGFFPAASAGWIVSDESFTDGADWLSFLKLRAGYGIIGNADVGNFANRALLGAGNDYFSQPGIKLSQLANPELSWEETAQFDAAVEFGLVDQRIRGSIAYFNKITTDLLLGRPISATNGFTTFTENIGEIKNTGLEFEVTADIITGDFNWSVNANISTINNEVLELPEGNDIVFGESLVREGEAVGSFFVVPYAGVDPENGDALFLDKDGNETSQFSLTNRRVQGSPFPDYYGGFGTNLAYKGLTLDVNFQYSQGNDIYWSDGSFLRTNLVSVFNQDVSQLDYWTPENTDATVPEPRFGVTNGSQSTANGRYLEDGSYLRLKSTTIGYTIPRDLVDGYQIRVYAQGTNLLTFDSFPGLDPEVTPNATTNVQQGNVFFQPPQQRTILFGIDLGL